jgi:glycosyltransferase involved in cell wall biosynthesis
MIIANISKKVLLIGPDYNNHRGGIGALIDVYKDQYEVFNFIPSFRYFNSKSRKSLFFLRQLFTIINFLSKNKDIKVLHIHSAKNGSLYRKLMIAYIAKVFFNKKIINHIHTGHFKHFYDDSNWLAKKSIRFFLEMNDVTITVSDSWKNYFTTSFHLKNVYKINNMVVNAGHNGTMVSHGPVTILFLGIITKAKGIFDLLKVLADNKALLENKLKLIVGGSGEIEELKAMIEKNSLSALVNFKGWVTGEEKQKLLNGADIYILPSYYEGVPISILEAMRYGKPIISTCVGGIPEIVEPGVNGLLVNPGDDAALLNCLLFYINDRENIHKHGRQSLNKIKDYYPEAITPQLEGIYKSLMA